MTSLALTISLPNRVVRSLASLLQPAKRHASLAELETLDERLLRDIGLSRIDVQDMRRMW